MPLEPFAGVLVSVAWGVKSVFDQSPQVTVLRPEPGSKCFDIHRCVITQLNLPHSIGDLTFTCVESLDMAAICAVEIQTYLSGRDGVQLSVVMYADVSNQYQQVAEGLRYLYSNFLIGMEERVVAQKNRKRQSKLIEDGKGFLKGLSITWPELCGIRWMLEANFTRRTSSKAQAAAQINLAACSLSWMNPLTALEYPDIWRAKNSALDQECKVNISCSGKWSILGNCVKE